MLIMGLGLGALLIVLGLLVYVFAPRVGPNPIFGVRVGYAYASHDIWDKTNRFGGTLMALVGFMVIILGFGLQLLNLAPASGIPVLTGTMIVVLLAATVLMFMYARELAQGSPLAREVRPVPFRWTYIAPVFVTFLVLVGVLAYFYPALPADRVASHFNFANQADGWMPRDNFALLFLGLAGLFLLLDLFVVYLATREPLVAFGRWGNTWTLDPARGLLFTGLTLGMVNLFLAVVLWDVGWFNTQGAHAFPLEVLLWLVIPLIVGIIALFFVLGRRTEA